MVAVTGLLEEVAVSWASSKRMADNSSTTRSSDELGDAWLDVMHVADLMQFIGNGCEFVQRLVPDEVQYSASLLR